jgi:ribosomal protein S18 acetylase RimI-like enzyme
MRIGSLVPADRARLASLLAATRAFSDEEVQVALSLFDHSLPELRMAGGAVDAQVDYEFLGALDDEGRLAGYACFGPTPSTVGTYDLYWLAVDPAAQGRGVGRALTDMVERRLGARGARLLVAETSGRADYEATRAFYRAVGYVETARVRDFYAPADDRIMLHKRLNGRERGVATR